MSEHGISLRPGAGAQADVERLQEIVDLGLLSPEADEILQQTAREAATQLGLPISTVTIVLDEAQFFAAAHGVEGWQAESRGTPVEWSFCAHAVNDRAPFIVEDATTHPVVRHMPIVENDGVVCYAGFPLISSRGHALGTLCVIGHEPHQFTDQELATLRSLADRAVARIEERRKPDPAPRG
ncbi:MAG TPA: GAF domain-containing protein [Longimicrobium sp.]|nr:GAF domain-containing protein [Longimicrobium sp.]